MPKLARGAQADEELRKIVLDILARGRSQQGEIEGKFTVRDMGVNARIIFFMNDLKAWADRRTEKAVKAAKEEIVFKIMSVKTDGLFDGGDLFIKRKPIEQVIIDTFGYEWYKAMQEAVNAHRAELKQEEAR